MSVDATYINESILSNLPKRPKDGHKGTFGRVLIIAGSENMCGASYLSALAAYRSGAGLVEIFAPVENRIILQCLLPEAILTTYSNLNDFKEKVIASIMLADSIVFGPGFGKRENGAKYIKEVIKTEKRLVIDADGLNILSENKKLLDKLPSNVILTPHIGEFSRLTGLRASEIKENKLILASEFAKRYGVVLILKDHETVIADPSGKLMINTFGNSGMGTGGSGDVLSGIIGAILALKKLDNTMCSAISVLMHAKAGDAAAEDKSERSIIARDIAEHIR